MFYQGPDMMYYMHDYYVGFFGGLQAMISEIYQIVNQKWTEEQVNFYHKFLYDLSTYIQNSVMTMQIYYFEDFQ